MTPYTRHSGRRAVFINVVTDVNNEIQGLRADIPVCGVEAILVVLTGYESKAQLRWCGAWGRECPRSPNAASLPGARELVVEPGIAGQAINVYGDCVAILWMSARASRPHDILHRGVCGDLPVNLYFAVSHASPVERIRREPCPDDNGIFFRVSGCHAKRKERIQSGNVLGPPSTK